ncbi:MAG: hypothetical protein P8184_18405, partial [Calditrichia bacterium]
KLYKPEFCRDHAGLLKNCSNAVECSVRSLWQLIQEAVDGALQNLTLQDMIGPDNKLNKKLFQLISERNSFPVLRNEPVTQ